MTLMQCVVTGGPTAEALDKVRRLTNISSGRLGIELAGYLAAQGHNVLLLLGEHSTWGKESYAGPTQRFSDTADLRERLRQRSVEKVDAVFHAAAVSDFTFGKVWGRGTDGSLEEVRSGKLSSRRGTLLAELVPTPKLISELREWYPGSRLVGWKYEVDGDQAGAVRAGREQLAAYRTDACVVNGPSYGDGFGLVKSAGSFVHLAGRLELFVALERFLRE